MTGQGLSPAGIGTVLQPLEQSQPSPRRARDDANKAGRLESHTRMETDVVDAEADVVDTLLTMRELATNSAGNDRVFQSAVGAQGSPRKESLEDDQGTHRSDSAATGSVTAAAMRDALCTQRQPLNAGVGSGLGSRPSSGAATHSLASRPNSFTGKKRKPGVKDEEPVNGASQAAQFRAGDSREALGVAAAEAAAALQLQQQLTAVAAAEALGWRQGSASVSGGGGDGQAAALPGNVGRVASEPLMNGGQRLPEAVLARLGLGSLGASAADAAAMERLRAMVLGSIHGAPDPGPSAKRPHVLGRQPSTAAAATTAALSLSADNLQQTATLHQHQHHHHQQPHHNHQQQKHHQQQSHQHHHQQHQHHHHVGAAAAAAGEQPTLGRQDLRTSAPAPIINGATAATAAALAAVMATERGAEAARRCTPPSPLGHHSDTGSDSGSPSTRAPYSPGKAHVTTHGSDAAAALATAAAAAAGSAAADGDEPSAPPAPLRTSSVVSLLHMLAIRQQQQQQQQQQSHGRGGPPQGRVPDLAELVAGADVGAMAAMSGERQGRSSWERERLMLQHAHDQGGDPRVGSLGPEHAAGMAAAVAAAGGFTGDARDATAAAVYGSGRATQQPRGVGAGGGGSGGGVLHRQVSYNSREHAHIAGVAPPGVDLMQVDSSSPPPPIRTVSGMAEAAHAVNYHPAAAGRSATAAAAAAERSAMDTADVPLTAMAAAAAAAAGLPYNAAAAGGGSGGGGGDERIHASLAAIERKLLLQEERLVCELKQVRLMQKLLHVQQMKQMVREAMRGKERHAAAAAPPLGPDGNMPVGPGSPFPTAAAPEGAVAPGGLEGAEAGLARLSSLPSHILAAAAARAAAACGGGGGGGGGGSLSRQLSGMEVLRANSDMAAGTAAGAAVHHQAGDLPYGGYQGHYQPLHAGVIRQSHPQHQRRGQMDAPADGADAAEEAWSAAAGATADGGGRLLSYIATLSNTKGLAAAALAAGGLMSAARRDGAAGTAGMAAAGGQGAPELSAAGGAPINAEGGFAGSRYRMHGGGGGGGGSDGGAAAALQIAGASQPSLGHRAVSDTVGGGGGAAAAGEVPPGGVAPDEEAAFLQRRLLLQVLLQHQRSQQVQLQLQDQVMPMADGDRGDGGEQS